MDPSESSQDPLSQSVASQTTSSYYPSSQEDSQHSFAHSLKLKLSRRRRSDAHPKRPHTSSHRFSFLPLSCTSSLKAITQLLTPSLGSSAVSRTFFDQLIENQHVGLGSLTTAFSRIAHYIEAEVVITNDIVKEFEILLPLDTIDFCINVFSLFFSRLIDELLTLDDGQVSVIFDLISSIFSFIKSLCLLFKNEDNRFGNYDLVYSMVRLTCIGSKILIDDVSKGLIKQNLFDSIGSIIVSICDLLPLTLDFVDSLITSFFPFLVTSTESISRSQQSKMQSFSNQVLRFLLFSASNGKSDSIISELFSIFSSFINPNLLRIKIFVGNSESEISFFAQFIVALPAACFDNISEMKQLSQSISSKLITALIEGQKGADDVIADIIELLLFPEAFSSYLTVSSILMSIINELRPDSKIGYREKQKLIKLLGNLLKKLNCCEGIPHLFTLAIEPNTDTSLVKCLCNTFSENKTAVCCDYCGFWLHTECEVGCANVESQEFWFCSACNCLFTVENLIKNLIDVDDLIEVKMGLRWLAFGIVYLGLMGESCEKVSKFCLSGPFSGQIDFILALVTDILNAILGPKEIKKGKKKLIQDDLVEKRNGLLNILNHIKESVSPNTIKAPDLSIISTIKTAIKSVNLNHFPMTSSIKSSWAISLFLSFVPTLSGHSIFTTQTHNFIFQKLISFAFTAPPAIKSWAVKAVLQTAATINSSDLHRQLIEILPNFLKDDSATVKTTTIGFIFDLIDDKLKSNLIESEILETVENYVSMILSVADDVSVSVRAKVLNIVKILLLKNLQNNSITIKLITSLLTFLTDPEDSVRDHAISLSFDLFFSSLPNFEPFTMTPLMLREEINPGSLKNRAKILILMAQSNLNIELLNESIPEYLVLREENLKPGQLKTRQIFVCLMKYLVKSCENLLNEKEITVENLSFVHCLVQIFNSFAKILAHLMADLFSDDLLIALLNPPAPRSDKNDTSPKSDTSSDQITVMTHRALISDSLDLFLMIISHILPGRPTETTSTILMDKCIKVSLQEQISSPNSIYSAAKLVGILSENHVNRSKIIDGVKGFLKKLTGIAFVADKSLLVTSTDDLCSLLLKSNENLANISKYSVNTPHRLLSAVTAFVMSFTDLQLSSVLNFLIICHYVAFRQLGVFLSLEETKNEQSFIQMSTLTVPSAFWIIDRFPKLSTFICSILGNWKLVTSPSRHQITILTQLITNSVSVLQKEGKIVQNSENLSSDEGDNCSVCIATKFLPMIKRALSTRQSNCNQSDLIGLWSSCTNFLEVLSNFGLVLPSELAVIFSQLIFTPLHVPNFENLDYNADEFSTLFTNCASIRLKSAQSITNLLNRFESIVCPVISKGLLTVLVNHITSPSQEWQQYFYIQINELFNLIQHKRYLFRTFISDLLRFPFAQNLPNQSNFDYCRLVLMETIIRCTVHFPFHNFDQVLFTCSKLGSFQDQVLKVIENLENLIFEKVENEDTIELIPKELSEDQILKNRSLDIDCRWQILASAAQKALLHLYDITPAKLESFSEGDPLRQHCQGVQILEESKYRSSNQILDDVSSIELGDFHSIHQILINQESFISTRLTKRKSDKKGKKKKK
ncbi:hypothetical protein P9112_010978 [Eukaryota sp. TZLM1-RC]